MSDFENISLNLAIEDDAFWLSEVSKRYYESILESDFPDAKVPRGYDSYKSHVRLMEYTDYYKILKEESTIGGIMIATRGESMNEILGIYIDPDEHGNETAIKVIQLLWEVYPTVKTWTVAYPEWSSIIRSFLEELNFTKVGLVLSDTNENQFWYEKNLDEPAAFTDIGHLKDGMKNVRVEGEIKEKSFARNVRSRRRGESLSVAEAGFEDTTGRILLTLWNEQIRQVKVGDQIRVENGYVGSYRGILQLNAGRAGKLVSLTD